MKKSLGRKLAPTVPLAAPPSAPPTNNKLFPVVGVGASAGGLEAFSTLISHLRETTGMAFVLVQHLDPSHQSALEEILSRKTKIPVRQVTDSMPVEPDHVYVIPANTDMTIKDGSLRLSPRTVSGGPHRPIDNFFRSLAEDCGDRAISVVLSGTASDGTAGSKAVKEVGGLTFAQDEATAKYSSMPASAVAAGCIDFVLPPKKIAEELSRISKLPYVRRTLPPQDEPLGTDSKNGMNGLFAMLREAKGVDFSLYKQSTLQRRVKRRMVVNNVEKLPEYVHFVKKHPAELTELYSDFLIPVTDFFRDPAAFQALRHLVFTQIFANARSAPVRIWVPGCSTGEEAYSLAMLFMEFWSDNDKSSTHPATPPLQVFATDISDDALDRARAASYSESALTGVSPARLKRFFVPLDGRYRIQTAIRELCVFARQNIAKDPPFSSLDLISCRNLLIYLGPDLQKRVIPSLHYALKPSGYLVVGSAESLNSFTDQFAVVDKKHRIYKKRNTGARLITYFSGVDASLRRPVDSKTANPSPSGLTLEREVDRILDTRFAPASVVVNSDMEIVRFRGQTSAFLDLPSGQPTFSLAKMAREGLFLDLRTAFRKAKKENTAVRKEGVALPKNGKSRLIDLEVIPIGSQGVGERFYLIVFQEGRRQAEDFHVDRRKSGKLSRKDSALARQNQHLSRELRHLREQLQSIVEENEANSEEFKTANEEVLSANEELQSTNEELETAKEELQSSNEELTTLNEEMQNRNTELGIANNDLLNLLANANITVVMVDNEARIRRFTPPAQELLGLRPDDAGRRIAQIRGAVEVNNLEEIVLETIETVQSREREVRDVQGTWYQLRVRPYKTMDNRIDGAVISFQDITAVKRSLEQMKLYADALIQNAKQPTLLLDSDLRVVVANRAFYDSFQVSPQQTENQLIYELGNNQWNIPALRQLLNRITRDDSRVDVFEVRHSFDLLGDRIMLLNARRVEPREGEFLIFLSIDDVTLARKQVDSLERQAALLDLAHDSIIVRDRIGNIQSWSHGAEEMYGWKKEEVLGKTTLDILQTQFPKPFSEIEEELRRTGHWQGQLVHKHRDGRQLFMSSRWAFLEQANSEGVILEINIDVSALKQSEASLRQLSTYLLNLQDEERRRIARELHDSTGQKLAAAKLQLDTLVKSGTLKSHEKSVAETVQWIDESFQEIRTLSQLLHPPLLDEAGLISATRWMVEGFSSRSKIQVDLHLVDQIGRLPQPVELALFRVIQESLSNINRHSGAKKAQVRLSRADSRVSLEVRDNGKGMPPELLSNSRHSKQIVGVGILGMRERLSQLGGTLEIESDETGTTVKVSVPVPAPSATAR
jgi:two-component system CheB/CheR fusion protein